MRADVTGEAVQSQAQSSQGSVYLLRASHLCAAAWSDTRLQGSPANAAAVASCGASTIWPASSLEAALSGWGFYYRIRAYGTMPTIRVKWVVCIVERARRFRRLGIVAQNRIKASCS